MPDFSPGMGEGIPVKRLTPKNYLKSFLDVSDSHKTSANLSVRAYFRQFSDWYVTYFGHSQKSPVIISLPQPFGSKLFQHNSRHLFSGSFLLSRVNPQGFAWMFLEIL